MPRPEPSRFSPRHIRASTASRWLVGVAVICLCTLPPRDGRAAEAITANGAVDFARDVYPVLRRACFECHGPDKQEAGLRLDEATSALDSAMIEPGRPEASELVRRIELPRGHEEVMPATGDPLSKRDVAVVRRWIAAGAEWPDNFEPPAHWAYVVPVRPALPEVSEPAWIRTPVDRFVLAKLDEQGLSPSPPAAPATLLRRVYLDLIGLPPTPEEVTAFENDPSPQALERIVDDLLSRPQFGERWARPWLDLARYADSHGFQKDDFRDLWAYRDWVIRALNEDMPFDRFTIEQLAGDLLPNASESQRIATGFHRCAATNVEAGSLPEETRIEQVIDRVNTTATVWLGSTLECAQCHDHKFDPFTAKDYYRLLAFFNSTALEADRANPMQPSSIAFLGPSMPVANVERDQERAKLEAKRSNIESQQAERNDQLASDLDAWASQFKLAAADASQSHVMEVQAFESEGNTDSYRVRQDGAVLLVGSDPPAVDVYRVTATVKAADVRAIKLEVLTDDSLAGRGPGRGDARRPNFVLNEFRASVALDQDESQPLKFTSANADHSQPTFSAFGAVDGLPKTGWAIAPQFSKPHWALFILDKPMDANGDITFTFELSQQFGRARTIGCFRLSAVSGDLGRESTPPEIASIVQQPPQEWTEEQRKQLIAHRARKDPPSLELQNALSDVTQRLEDLAPDTTLVMVELDEPRPSAVFLRGDYRTPGEAVTAGTPAWLHPLPGEDLAAGPGESPVAPNRLTLARWLVARENPLVARVTVNRWWAELFGAGIVRTPEDFGIKGEPPTHPELLDWLAVELMEKDWSMKQLLRAVVLSSCYQQSSAPRKDLMSMDDQNRWLARGPRYRLDAEMIRDNALAIAGLLSMKQQGPPIRPYQPDGVWSKVGGVAYRYVVSPGEQKYRRGIYVVIKRGGPYPSFVNFDAASRLTCTVSRSRTNTPLQSLTLLNDPVYVEAAKAIALRASSASKQQSPRSTIEAEFLRCTARLPTDQELDTLLTLYREQHDEAEKHAQAARQLSSDVSLPSFVSGAEFSAWYSIATVLLNLHETITKE